MLLRLYSELILNSIRACRRLCFLHLAKIGSISVAVAVLEQIVSNKPVYSHHVFIHSMS
jgi:hypothetical protein